MSGLGDSFNIPHFISSESLEGLRAKMLENNLKDKVQYNYYSIIFDGSNYVAFYYRIAKELSALKKIKSSKKV
jgi:hypothetical protein